MKTENRKKENAGSMESLELRTVHGRERERVREKTQEKLYSKNSNSILFNLHVCVFNAHLYTSSYKD